MLVAGEPGLALGRHRVDVGSRGDGGNADALLAGLLHEPAQQVGRPRLPARVDDRLQRFEPLAGLGRVDVGELVHEVVDEHDTLLVVRAVRRGRGPRARGRHQRTSCAGVFDVRGRVHPNATVSATEPETRSTRVAFRRGPLRAPDQSVIRSVSSVSSVTRSMVGAGEQRVDLRGDSTQHGEHRFGSQRRVEPPDCVGRERRDGDLADQRVAARLRVLVGAEELLVELLARSQAR